MCVLLGGLLQEPWQETGVIKFPNGEGAKGAETLPVL